MAERRQKLELTWIGKENRPRLEPRILLEDPSLSYHAPQRVTDTDQFENLLIHGDNLLALKALEQEFSGKVKCIYIDPPYNTGAAFEQYDDGVEHSVWLSLMRDRLEVLRTLLATDGSIWINLDDSESHYCKVVCDELFGRPNFLGNVVWEKSDSPRMDADFFSSRHDHILVYAKDRTAVQWHRLSLGEDGIPAHYDKLDEHGVRYYLKPLRAMGGQGDTREKRPSLYYEMTAPDGTPVFPKRQDGTDGAWRWRKQKVEKERHRIDWINGRNGWAPYFRIYAKKDAVRPPETIWAHADVGSNRTSKLEIKALAPEAPPFGTPKPERLIHRVLSIASSPGDLVLDSFGGSGTTGAVAHKMGRRWIMVELGDHCFTHIVPRLHKVIDGADPGGVTEATGWRGGGGFRLLRVAPSLLAKDRFGQWVVNPAVRREMLVEAVCKLHGFNFAPSQETYWQHGRSTERDWIYVTTQTLTRAQLEAMSEEVGPDRSLLVCCSAYRGGDDYPNLTVRKIPQSVLGRCEWGRDDYSLNVKAILEQRTADASRTAELASSAPDARGSGRGRKPKVDATPSLFGQGDAR